MTAAAFRSITPEDVHLAPAGAVARVAACPACGWQGPGQPVLDVPTLSPPHRTLSLLRCGQCASLFYVPAGIRDFSDLGGQDADFWRFYVEAAGGIWETLWPVAAARPRGRLLDVGCGFGFALDFWARSGRGEAIGVELAAYGAVGARELGVTILDQRLETCPALAAERFDVVYASEVIEHVDDPRAFVALLARRVTDDGMLVLTTPAAEFMSSDNLSPGMLAALAPGFHALLLSGAAFESAAREAGFAHVTVRRFAERQVLWASRRPFALDLDETRLRSHYFDYMRARAGSLDPQGSVGLGYAYRLLRDEVNLGRFAEATPGLRALGAAIRSRFGPGALDPQVAVAAYRAATTLVEVGRVGPYFLAGFFLHGATLAQHVERDYARARAWYRAAADLAVEGSRIGVVLFLEAPTLVWPARIADAVLGLALGDEGAAEGLLALMERGLQPSAATGYARVEHDRIETLLPPVIDELGARGQWGSAQRLSEAYAAYVARHYGAELTVLDGIEAALRENAQTPVDPLFVPYAAALLSLRDPSHSEAARTALADFAVRAERVVGSASGRARELATKARRAGGIAETSPPFSFEMSFDLTPKR